MRSIFILAVILLLSKANADYCAGRPFNPNYYHCCHGTLLSRSYTKTECCARQQYNPAIEVCCSGEILPKIRAERCAKYEKPNNRNSYYQNPFFKFRVVGK